MKKIDASMYQSSPTRFYRTWAGITINQQKAPRLEASLLRAYRNKFKLGSSSDKLRTRYK